jgi:hypothetical protein
MTMMSKPVLIQYEVTFAHADSLPLDIQRSLNRPDGSFCPVIDQTWSYSQDYRYAIAPGFRPLALRGEGRSGTEGRRGDWVVTESHEFEPTTPHSPYRAIVVCSVEYQPVPEPQWFKVSSVEPVLEPA